ncbi:MAG: hypothetical protein ACEPOZ_09705 [Marinifilaceae bacterium]
MGTLNVRHDFIEKSEEGFDVKSENFCKKIEVYAATLGLTTEQVDGIKGILTGISNARQLKNTKKLETKASIVAYNEQRKYGEVAIRDFKRIIESSANCTPAILEELGMANSKRSVDTDNQQPDLSVRMLAGVPQIRYSKIPFDGIRLWSRINDGPFDFQETVTHNSFDDHRPMLDPTQPEVREYYAFYISKRKIVGQQSKTIRITLPAKI